MDFVLRGACAQRRFHLDLASGRFPTHRRSLSDSVRSRSFSPKKRMSKVEIRSPASRGVMYWRAFLHGAAHLNRTKRFFERRGFPITEGYTTAAYSGDDDIDPTVCGNVT